MSANNSFSFHFAFYAIFNIKICKYLKVLLKLMNHYCDAYYPTNAGMK